MILRVYLPENGGPTSDGALTVKLKLAKDVIQWAEERAGVHKYLAYAHFVPSVAQSLKVRLLSASLLVSLSLSIRLKRHSRT